VNRVAQFETQIAEYFGSPYAVATDCCTHAIELCLRLLQPEWVACPNHTYLSVPMTFDKLNIGWAFNDAHWHDYYYINNTNIIDAAVYWKKNGYIAGSMMCLSFQFKKHLNLGRGGMILLDNAESYAILKKMRYDGRDDSAPWAEQNIDTMGYHYYMTPETAEAGLLKFQIAKETMPRQWSHADYPDISKMKVFNDIK
jgi:dTDP-4-amino-4,6-dideoxygalactose transaminase